MDAVVVNLSATAGFSAILSLRGKLGSVETVDDADCRDIRDVVGKRR